MDGRAVRVRPRIDRACSRRVGLSGLRDSHRTAGGRCEARRDRVAQSRYRFQAGRPGPPRQRYTGSPRDRRRNRPDQAGRPGCRDSQEPQTRPDPDAGRRPSGVGRLAS